MKNFLQTHMDNRMDDCIYSSILSVINSWCCIDVEMIGADAWGFEFTKANSIESKNYVDLIWNRVHAYQENSWKSLETYYGAKVIWNHTRTYDESLPLIKEELANNRPILVYINSRFCPWHPRRDKDNMHFCLIVGMYEDSFNCVDIILNVQNGMLPLHLFSQGCGPCITFSKSNKPRKKINWKEVISNALDRLGSGNLYAFNSMRRMSQELTDEINNASGMISWIENPIPVVINVNLLQKGRVYFSITLKYLAQRYYQHNLLPISNRLLEAAKKWNSISFMTYKIKSNPSSKNTLIKIPQKICEIAKFEEEIALDLTYLLKS